jgi:hypothetical protein
VGRKVVPLEAGAMGVLKHGKLVCVVACVSVKTNEWKDVAIKHTLRVHWS